MTTDHEYLLGHGGLEWDRLEHQHRVWRHTLLNSLAPLHIGAGSRILEVGCGNGALLRDLAELVGAEGEARGLEIDPEAAAQAQEKLKNLPWAHAEHGDILELEPASRPGVVGTLVLQERVTEILDVEKVIRDTEPSFFEQDQLMTVEAV